MSKMPEYQRGVRDGIRWAVSWLHARSQEMNDPHARTILDTAAFHMGVERKEVSFIDPGPASRPSSDGVGD